MVSTFFMCFNTAFIIIFIWIMLKPGMILGWLRPTLEKIPYKFIRKPLFECNVCMTSIWGTLAWFALWRMPLADDIILYLLITGGIVTVISYFIGESE